MPAKILIAEDEADFELLIRQRFRKQIREQVYEFLFARNGAEAIVKLREHPDVELVLSDINMPVMDGLALLDKLSEVNPYLRAVIVSAYGDMTNIRTAMNRGALDFLTKPIDFHDFELTLKKTLDHARDLRQSALNRAQLAALQRELAIAAEIQQSILPRVFPPFPERTDVDLHAQMIAARNVGGDFYDFFFLDRDRLGIVIGDVSGKGVPAAIFMAMSRALLKAVALRGLPPGKCLCEVNQSLCRDSAGEMFVTLFYGILDLASGTLHYSNGGHNPPYVLSPDRPPVFLESTGDTLLGMFDDLSFHTREARLDAGDGLFLYTDGVTEARNPDEALFEEKRLGAVLAAHPRSDARTLVEAVVEEVKKFAATAPQSDDITVLAVRCCGSAAY